MKFLLSKVIQRFRYKSDLRDLPFILLSLAPAIVILGTFMIGPMIFAFLLSFHEWSLIGARNFVGLKNYVNLVFKDPTFRVVLWNTIYYSVGTVPLTLFLSLFVALILNRQFRGRGVFRTVFFLPVITSMVTVGVVWKFIFQPESGLLNSCLRIISLKGTGWLDDPTWAMPSIIIVSIWKNIGYGMLFFLAGLQSIPNRLYEAASIDGANKWNQFWHITLPSLRSVMLFLVIISTINSFKVFDLVYVMTGGGPIQKTLVIVYSLYDQGFHYFRMGYASAMACILTGFLLVFSIIQFKYFSLKE